MRTPKIARHAVGENYADTFRVEDGVLKVAYDKYPRFDNKFGHLFYKTPFSHYRLRIEYRFVGEQSTGGPSWPPSTGCSALAACAAQRWAARWRLEISPCPPTAGP